MFGRGTFATAAAIVGDVTVGVFVVAGDIVAGDVVAISPTVPANRGDGIDDFFCTQAH